MPQRPVSLEEAGEQRAPQAGSIIVQKYGGSSLADVDKLGRVADRVVATRGAGHRVVVVVSAMGKTTDGLLDLAQQVAAGGGGELAAAPPRRELDMLVSTGERVAMSLLSIAIQARGHAAISFTGSQCGIITNDRHFDARIIEVRPHRIEDELARDRVVIVAGYQGVSYRREITTLGRGGTDTTAVALAAALGAERCEIYSDVDGVYSADPRSVEHAGHLPEIDHAMLQQMAQGGAKVLCAQAVEWARRANIALYARATLDPPSEAPRQTIVRKLGPRGRPPARAVVADEQIALVRLGGGGKLTELLEALTAGAVAVADLSAGPEGVAAVLSLVNTPDWPAARRALGARFGADAVTEAVSRVSVVGDGLTERPDHLCVLRALLEELGTEVYLLTATALRMSAVVDADASVAAQRALHAAFVEPRRRR